MAASRILKQPLESLLRPDEKVAAFVGAGGKTSLIYSLARRIAASGKRVVVTTTTRMMAPEENLLLLPSPDPIPEYNLLNVGKAVEQGSRKLVGFAPEEIGDLLTLLKPDILLIEADGAARRPIKAPRTHEPVVPELADLVVGVMGLDALGKPVEESTAFRIERFCAVTGLAPGETIGPEAFTALAAHPEGLFKGAPARARKVAFHNKADVYPALGQIYGSALAGWFVSQA